MVISSFLKFVSIVLFTGMLVSCLSKRSQTAPPFPAAIDLAEKSPDSFLVKFNTTKGSFTMKARRSWSPLGSDRFYLLVKNGFYNGNVIYRVAPTKSYEGGFLVQFGIANSIALNKAWETATIADEPVIRPHQAGAVNYARGGPNTRSVELAITVTPCLELDTVSYFGVKGFPTFALVEKGMDVVRSFNGQYGNSVFDHEDSLQQGRAYLDRVYPGLDRIINARITKKW